MPEEKKEQEQKPRFNIYTVIADILRGKDSAVSSGGNIFEALGLKPKKTAQEIEEEKKEDTTITKR